MDPAFIPIIIFIAVWVGAVIIAVHNVRKKNRSAVRRYGAVLGHHTAGHTYVQGQFSDQMELDMRLPYKRFKKLYPGTTWTYDEYKKMQMRTAFRRSMSSQDNKRMVR